MTREQWALILAAVDNCVQCMAHQPSIELGNGFDILPMDYPLANLQGEWFMNSRSVHHD